MPHNSTNTQNCPFCDSASHSADACKSTMEGKADHLKNMMQSDSMPQFQDLTKKELKYVAFSAKYQHTMWCNTSKNEKFNREYGLDIIHLSLSRKRLILALRARWETLIPVRERMGVDPNYLPDANNICPVCYTEMTKYVWDPRTARWNKYNVPSKMPAKSNTGYTDCFIIPPVRTSCNHSYCGNCWDNWCSTSAGLKLVYSSSGILSYPIEPNQGWDSDDDDPVVNCPMCRAEIQCGIPPCRSHHNCGFFQMTRRPIIIIDYQKEHGKGQIFRYPQWL
jgi:hypothetical protein